MLKKDNFLVEAIITGYKYQQLSTYSQTEQFIQIFKTLRKSDDAFINAAVVQFNKSGDSHTPSGLQNLVAIP